MQSTYAISIYTVNNSSVLLTHYKTFFFNGGTLKLADLYSEQVTNFMFKYFNKNRMLYRNFAPLKIAPYLKCQHLCDDNWQLVFSQKNSFEQNFQQFITK